MQGLFSSPTATKYMGENAMLEIQMLPFPSYGSFVEFPQEGQSELTRLEVKLRKSTLQEL